MKTWPSSGCNRSWLNRSLGEETLSYRQLEERVNRLARHLRTLGVGPEERVGIMMERSPDMVVAILAVFKAGGAYVPLHPEYPAKRLAFMIQDSCPRVLLTRKGLASRLPPHSARLVEMDGDSIAPAEASPIPRKTTEDNLAYIISFFLPHASSPSVSSPQPAVRDRTSIRRQRKRPWQPR